MRFGLFSIAFLLGSAVARPTALQLDRRDTTVIEAHLKKLTADLTILKNTLKTLPTGGDKAAADREAKKLLSQLVDHNRDQRDGAVGIKRTQPMKMGEDGRVVSEINALSNLMHDVLGGFATENTKKMIWTAGKRDAQQRFASELKVSADGARELSDIMISKLSSSVLTLAGQSFKTAFSSLFQPTLSVSLHCKNSNPMAVANICIGL
jgi:hypothetical protein